MDDETVEQVSDPAEGNVVKLKKKKNDPTKKELLDKLDTLFDQIERTRTQVNHMLSEEEKLFTKRIGRPLVPREDTVEKTSSVPPTDEKNVSSSPPTYRRTWWICEKCLLATLLVLFLLLMFSHGMLQAKKFFM